MPDSALPPVSLTVRTAMFNGTNAVSALWLMGLALLVDVIAVLYHRPDTETPDAR